MPDTSTADGALAPFSLTRGDYVYVPRIWSDRQPPPELHELAVYLGPAIDAFGWRGYRIRRVAGQHETIEQAAYLVPAGRIDGHTLSLANGIDAPLWCPDCADTLTGDYMTALAEARQTYDWYVCDRCHHEFTVAELLARPSYTRAALSQSAAQGLAALVFSFARHAHRRPTL